MDTAIIIFLCLVSLIIVFSIIVFVYEMIRERKNSAQPEKSDSEAQALAASAAALAASAAALAKLAETPATVVVEAQPAPVVEEEAPVEEPAPEEVVAEPVAEEAPAEEAAEEETEIAATESDNNVAFNAAPAPTHEEKYAELPEEARGWYDAIAEYAAAVEGSKQFVCKRYEEYSLKGRKIVRFMIKRGVTVCEFVLRNNDFDTYVTENKVSVSAAPTSMKVTGPEIIDAAKGAIDIVVRGIYDELDLKRRLANERRRAKRAAAAAEAEAEAEADVDVEVQEEAPVEVEETQE